MIATPGRLNDFLSQRLITLSRTTFCVLDEADRMLDMGFEPQIRQICEQYDLPPASARNTLMFSATFPVEVQKIAQKYMRPYVFVAVGRVGSTVSSITQRIVQVRANDKRLKLETVIPLIVPADKTIIFCQKKHVATWVKNQLMRSLPGAIRVDAIHGDRSQSQREHALELFRDGKLDILVATDVAARGLDVPGINHVIQFDLPVSVQDFDNYVHRIGRTGRAGRLGVATALFVPGVDGKSGQNGALLKPLCELLEEGKQEIPQWLATLRGGGGGGGNGVTGGQHRNGGGGSGAVNQQSQPRGKVTKQPQRDARGKSNMVTVSSAVVSTGQKSSGRTSDTPTQQQHNQPKRNQQNSSRERVDPPGAVRSMTAPLPGQQPQNQGQNRQRRGRARSNGTNSDGKVMVKTSNSVHSATEGKASSVSDNNVPSRTVSGTIGQGGIAKPRNRRQRKMKDGSNPTSS